MTKNAPWLLGLVPVLSLAIAACAELPTGEAPGAPEPTPVPPGDVVAAAAPPVGSDARFLRMAHELPGFGGMFYDEGGRLSAYFAPGPDGPALAPGEIGAGVTRELAAQGRAVPAGEVVVLQAEHAFTRLHEWNQRATALLSMDGVVFTAVDERRNRLRVGVTNDGARAQVEAELVRLDIPAEAVIMDRAQPIQALSEGSLQDRVRPVAGGLQLVFERPGVGFFLCTLGVNVRLHHPGMSRPHFLTNSHCTAQQGAPSNTRYWQNLPDIPPFSAKATFIGSEVLDPSYFSGGICPDGRVCRLSDASMAEYTRGQGAAMNFGSVYRTTFFGTGNAPGSLEIESDRPPRFRIVGDQPFPLAGETLDKVGRTTGWTRGEVILTCANVNVSDTNITLLCQDLVQALALGGDSGSPVFRQVGGSGNVEFYGLLWGSGAIGPNAVHAFSAVSNIQFELGAFQTH